MNEIAEYTNQLAQSYKKLSQDYIAQAQAYDDLNRLYMESVKRADAAEARVKELEQIAARQQGGATTPTYQTSGVVRARLEQQAAMQAELNPPQQGGAE